MNLTQYELAYIAGFLEGDGSFQIMKYKSKTCGIVYEYRISAYNTKEAVISWFHERVGGYYAKVKTSERNKQPFHWNIKNQEAIKLAELIYPYMLTKKEELETWLKFSYTIIPNRTTKRTSECIEEREQLISHIRNIRTNRNLVNKEDCIEYCKIKQIGYPTEIDMAFFAGFVDAEGCFRLHRLIKKNRPNPTFCTVLEVGNTNTLIFPWLMSKFGGNITFSSALDYEKRKKNIGVWYIMASQLRKIYDDLAKYLIIKKPVCEKIIEFDKTNLPNGGDRHSQAFKDNYKSILAKRECIFKEIQELNAKGHH